MRGNGRVTLVEAGWLRGGNAKRSFINIGFRLCAWPASERMMNRTRATLDKNKRYSKRKCEAEERDSLVYGAIISYLFPRHVPSQVPRLSLGGQGI